MSTASLRTRSSLTPIENTDVDPFDNSNSSKSHALHGRDRHSAIAGGIEPGTEVYSADIDERHVQDTSSLERSATTTNYTSSLERSATTTNYSQSDASTLQTTQTSESTMNMSADTDRDAHDQQPSGEYAERSTGNVDRSNSPSILVVRESPSDRVLDTVDGTNSFGTNDDDDVDDDDEYSSSDESNQSENDKSLNSSVNSEAELSDSANRKNFRSHNDLSNIEEEEMTSRSGDDHLQFTSNQRRDKQETPSPNKAKAENYHETGNETNEKLASMDNLLDPPRNNQINDEDIPAEAKQAHPADLFDRTDSVECSYFASFTPTNPHRLMQGNSATETQDLFIPDSLVEESDQHSSQGNSSLPDDESKRQVQRYQALDPNKDVEEPAGSLRGYLQSQSIEDCDSQHNQNNATHSSETTALTGELTVKGKEKDVNEMSSYSEILPSKEDELTTEQGRADENGQIATYAGIGDHEEIVKTSDLKYNNDPEISNKNAELQNDSTREQNDKVELHPKDYHVGIDESSTWYAPDDSSKPVVLHGDESQQEQGDSLDHKDASGTTEEYCIHNIENDAFFTESSFSRNKGDTTNGKEIDSHYEKCEYNTNDIDVSNSGKKGTNSDEEIPISEISEDKTFVDVPDVSDMNVCERIDEQSTQGHTNQASNHEANQPGDLSISVSPLTNEASIGLEGLPRAEVDNHEPIPKEPLIQEIERDSPDLVTNVNDVGKGDNADEPVFFSNGRTSPSTFVSEDSESTQELHAVDGGRTNDVPGTMRASKSLSTLSVKTVSSSSSRTSTSTRPSKDDNKKLDLLLKGPYAENQKSPTPRLKAKQANSNIKKKVAKSQSKVRSSVGSAERKPTNAKLQVHKTRKKVADITKSNINPKGAKSNGNDKGSNDEISSLLSQLDEAITQEHNTRTNNHVEHTKGAEHEKEESSTTVITEQPKQQSSEQDRNLEKEKETGEENKDIRENEEENELLDENQHKSTENQLAEQRLAKDATSPSGVDENVDVGVSGADAVKTKQSEKDVSDISISENTQTMKGNSSTKKNGENKQTKQSFMMGKKKIIISSPKASERLSAKEAKNATPLKQNGVNTTSTGLQKKSNADSKRPSTAPNVNKNGIPSAIVKVENVDEGMKPTSITIIDETNDSPKTNPPAGRIILNNIKMNLQKKSLGKHANQTSKSSKGKTRTQSPEGKSLNNSGPRSEGRMAYKTQSMSSLQVPGHIAGPNSWDHPKEEDALSTYSRRPSMDSVSRKSVDYRIRTTTTVIQPQGEEKPKSVFNNDETFIQTAVPCLPLGLSIVCLVLNTVLPGSGTALSGVSILCCGQSRLSSKEDQVLNTMCANLLVGLAQLLTVTFMLVGWFWSVGWGIKMVSLSVKRRHEIRQQREKDLQTLALSAFGSPKRLGGFGL